MHDLSLFQTAIPTQLHCRLADQCRKNSTEEKAVDTVMTELQKNVTKCREYQEYCSSLKQRKEPRGREMWKEYFVGLVKDVTLKYLLPETMVFLTEQQFS